VALVPADPAADAGLSREVVELGNGSLLTVGDLAKIDLSYLLLFAQQPDPTQASLRAA